MYVFFDGRGLPLRVANMSRELRQYVIDPLSKQWGLPEDDRTFRRGRVHSLRHYFCSQCAAAGVPMQTTQQWLGHKDSEMTRHYYHLHDEESHRQMARLQQHLADAAGGRSSAA
jgi:integrase